MKLVILAGGYGTRISEESHLKPKPMIEIGEMPIIWHIMKHYSVYGINDFIICAGYRQHVIKEWFADYFLHTSDVTFDFTRNNKMIIHEQRSEDWKVTVVDTGLDTMTGGRIKRVHKYVGDETFCLTYGDAVSDVDISKLIETHRRSGKIVTITTVSMAQAKGIMEIADDGTIEEFREKDDADGSLINGGFMVCEPKVFDYLKDDSTIFEQYPLKTMAAERQLMSYYHGGFWQCMDTKREKDKLEELWASGHAPWKVWKD